ncbi:hypothetical protein Kpol_1018p94 [Vanderwaltozyma polyspora DSM 70294]|uniref:Enoyl reductase (ER) domain-containing protein n=1 Tax=Vanderwaltozyma polyspora (strain ATCC 22028 / DSM 70294 / BCRC 21397 / CBS 2163 / NBRC 10782 / NRRL Y-8283 / UCD 57-17) TaxID=436907 RepID=A7TDU1_VANPO|nr:uncharacterized protein Kpol_1018p94 [Vanderwaltozyma polyspora DSM 70294]EDO19561.1 hypothetical protein Kpol_1018p94 [Vanderwaltozyma polyspora DSM 70294]
MSKEDNQPAPMPKKIEVEDSYLKRVARPLRHVKFIPTKALVFQTKTGPVDFTYENKIKTPIGSSKLVVDVRYVGLNPVDLMIKNGYNQQGFYGEIGLGREYFGVISDIGSKLESDNRWKIGDEVMGIYYHPHIGYGSLQTSILVDPKQDPLVLKPENVTMPEAGGSLFCLASAFEILEKLNSLKKLTPNANILINGGTSSVGLFALQLLKNYYHIVSKVTIVTSGTGPKVIKQHMPGFEKDFIFIDYLACRGKASKPLLKLLEDNTYTYFDEENGTESIENYSQGKYDIVLDFIGGYDILSQSQSLIHSGGHYVTTVGDYVADYKTDVFEHWDNPSASARKMFGNILWSYNYTHYKFDPNGKTELIEKCAELLGKRYVKCIVDNVYDWKDYKEAFNYMKLQRAQGKLILKVEKF